MMAKRPADRYQSMTEVADALWRWLADSGQGSQGRQLAERPDGPHSAHRRRLPSSAARRRDSGELPLRGGGNAGDGHAQ